MSMPRFLVCPPNHFDVKYVINPWMKDNIGRVDTALAHDQWHEYVSVLSKVADVEHLDPHPGLPDMVFVANAGLIHGTHYTPSKFSCVQRRKETPIVNAWFSARGYTVAPLRDSGFFEGTGDALWEPGQDILWAGYGIRTSLQVYYEIAQRFSVEIRPLRLIDDWFYHLDTCFLLLRDDRVVYFPNAFDHDSLEIIRDYYRPECRIEVDEEDARLFACNAVIVNDHFIVNGVTPALQSKLEAWGYEVCVTPLSEFILAGGAARCLCLDLDHVPDPLSVPKTEICSHTVELDGQLIDMGILDQALDAIVNAGGSFEIRSLEAGLRHDQESIASVMVTSPNATKLEWTLSTLIDMGARMTPADTDASLETVVEDGVAPANFYCTSIYPTAVRIDGAWRSSEVRRMDAVLVVSPLSDTICSTLLRDLKRGDRVVCGVDGIEVQVPTASAVEEGFEFMSASVSSERRVELAVADVASEMERIRERGGRIVVVAGPVVVHTGGAPHLAALIREGYVDALLGGNAIATHDIECALYGTSLGVDLNRGVSVQGGHRHHLKAINSVRAHSGIAAMVREDALRSGIMYECVKCDVPFALAGSIRDDGPLPDTQMDLVLAQEEYAELIEGADMILMLASMLHSIGVGNMTPSGVRLICVDISPAVVTKLADRGSLESVGIVTDVGLFLNLLRGKLTNQPVAPSEPATTACKKSLVG